jgi:hypothetical protein
MTKISSIDGHLARNPKARPKARFFGPAQARLEPNFVVPGLPRPDTPCQARAATPAHRAARPDTHIKQHQTFNSSNPFSPPPHSRHSISRRADTYGMPASPSVPCDSRRIPRALGDPDAACRHPYAAPTLPPLSGSPSLTLSLRADLSRKPLSVTSPEGRSSPMASTPRHPSPPPI